ncbi:MAG: hypothetical protein KBS41_04765 [Oscillospiraceae bacterium]|nr:hypothetical protein [Candidatus Equicaccousia limihippi]
MRRLAIFLVTAICFTLLFAGFIIVEQKIVADRTGETYPVISVKNGEVRFFDRKIMNFGEKN